MSSSHETGAPFSLATLPTSGRSHAASVCSISGIKKRKRTEVAVALDGEGLFIYSLQNPQLVTSYALPPSTTFTVAPLCVYRKGLSKTPSQRFTYASVSESAQGDSPRLVCFHETILGEKTETTKTAYNPSDNARILALDALPVTKGGSGTSSTHDILVTLVNGDVLCLSSDLQQLRWTANLTSLGLAGATVEKVSTASAKSVIRGLLRNREDIATVLTSSANDSSDLLELTQVLCVLGRNSQGAIRLRLIQVQPRSQDLTTTPSSPLKQLVSWDLPNPSRTPASPQDSVHYSLHASSGVLHTLTETSLLSYDFSEIVPKLYSELTLPGPVDTFLRLSQDKILTTSRQTCRVFDVKYKTLQMVQSLDVLSGASSTASPAKKRKLSHGEEDSSAGSQYSLIAHHADQGLVVAIRENELVGMSFGDLSSRKRVKPERTLLSDALGKGVAPAVIKTNQKWHQKKAKLDQYVSDGDIRKFEETIARTLGIELDEADAPAAQDNEVTGGPLTNGVGPKIPEEDAMAIDLNNVDEEDGEDVRSWNIPDTINPSSRHQAQEYASYTLSKIFRPTSSDPDHSQQNLLTIDFFAPNVFHWLLRNGHISAASIRHAVLEESPEHAQVLSSIADGDVVKALVQFDPEMHILSAVLNDRGHLPIGEVVQALQLLLQSMDEQAKGHGETKLLTNGTAPSEDEMDLDVTSELAAASEEMDHAMSMLDHGLQLRSHTLRPTLIRLHTFTPRLITSTLRSMLSRRELDVLVNVLHLEMKNEGWSLPYDSQHSETEPSNETPDDHAVAIIASLLSCTLDAVGAGAWLATSDSSEDTIYALHNDTSEALLGFFEARYMRGLLGEFLRYASNVPKSSKAMAQRQQAKDKPFAVTKDLADLPMLPLGAKQDWLVDNKKMQGGKRVERSKREMGQLISRKVPKYSFERIVI